MCSGYKSDPQSVTDQRQTAMIDKELGHLNMDVAALQETRAGVLEKSIAFDSKKVLVKS